MESNTFPCFHWLEFLWHKSYKDSVFCSISKFTSLLWQPQWEWLQLGGNSQSLGESLPMLFWYPSTLQFHICNVSNSFGRLGEWNVEISSNPKPLQSVTLQTQSSASNREFKTLFSHFTSDQRKCGMLALALNFNQFNSKYMKSKCISRTSERVTKCLASSTLSWWSWFLFCVF